MGPTTGRLLTFWPAVRHGLRAEEFVVDGITWFDEELGEAIDAACGAEVEDFPLRVVGQEGCRQAQDRLPKAASRLPLPAASRPIQSPAHLEPAIRVQLAIVHAARRTTRRCWFKGEQHLGGNADVRPNEHDVFRLLHTRDAELPTRAGRIGGAQREACTHRVLASDACGAITTLRRICASAVVVARGKGGQEEQTDEGP